ncbi:MAG: stage II sporulation protein M [Clostridia bacterium]|nr:stage II sporulation protein M [Clostridia bacterium]
MFDNMSYSAVMKAAVIPALFLAAGAVFGSICAGGISGEESAELYGYFSGFFGNVSGADRTVLLSSVRQYGILWLILAVSGCALPGFIPNMLVVSKRGFVTGYTAACFYKIYGYKGAFACISLLPEMLVFLPALIVFSSFSLKMSFLSRENKKNFLKKYILILIIFLSIFCVVSILQSYATTIFMKFISARM